MPRHRRGGRDPAAAACSTTAGDGAELLALFELVLKRLRWGGKVLCVDALIAWARVASKLDPRPEPPAVTMTWLELEPHAAPAGPQELERFADWLRLAELLREHDPEMLARLDFPDRYKAVLEAFADDSPLTEPVLERELRIETLYRLATLDPELAGRAMTEVADIALPVLSYQNLDPPPPRREFPVERVLRDLG